MYNLNAIKIFIAVAETKGFTSASDRLDMPKSKVSRSISSLEDQLKVRLFERSTRHVRLTEGGEIFLQYAQRINYEAEQSESALHSIATIAQGKLRVSVSTSVGQFLLGPSLHTFMLDYPGIEIDLDISNRRVDLIEENFDVALRLGHLSDSSLVAKKVGVIPLKLYASHTYLKKYGEPADISELKHHKILCMPNALKKNRLLLRDSNIDTLSHRHNTSIEVNFFARINDFGTIYELAKNGIGIALLPIFMCHHAQSLQAILVNWEINLAPLHIVYPSHRGVTPKLRAFTEFVNETLVPQLQTAPRKNYV